MIERQVHILSESTILNSIIPLSMCVFVKTEVWSQTNIIKEADVAYTFVYEKIFCATTNICKYSSTMYRMINLLWVMDFSRKILDRIKFRKKHRILCYRRSKCG